MSCGFIGWVIATSLGFGTGGIIAAVVACEIVGNWAFPISEEEKRKREQEKKEQEEWEKREAERRERTGEGIRDRAAALRQNHQIRMAVLNQWPQPVSIF